MNNFTHTKKPEEVLMDNNDYSQLAGTSFMSKPQVDPKDELFHSVYIAGQQRTNEAGIDELPGQLQIRGVQYNQSTLHMIITHVKQVLVKMEKVNGKDQLGCFSYQEGDMPFKGTSGNVCGRNSPERAAVAFCNPCRAQIVVAGLLTNSAGSPVVGEDGKPTLVFLRGKGMKYSNVSNYLNEMSQLELPMLVPENPNESLEKGVFNRSRFITQISVGTASSNYGPKTVFELVKTTQLPDEVVKTKILKLSMDLLSKFNEKFDWSQGKAAQSPPPAQTPPQEGQTFGGNEQPPSQNNEQAQTGTQTPEVDPFANANFNFDDVAF